MRIAKDKLDYAERKILLWSYYYAGTKWKTYLSNSRKYVEFQRYIFEALWKKAIPAKQRIREIEEGTKREVVEVIRDSSEI